MTPEQRRKRIDRVIAWNAARRAAGVCINGPLVGTVGERRGIEHGPVVQGGRCQRCLDVKRSSH